MKVIYVAVIISSASNSSKQESILICNFK